MSIVDITELPLTEVLSRLGWRYESPSNPRLKGQQVYDDKGGDMGVLTYDECVTLLREKGLVG